MRAGAGAVRELAARHGIRPSKALGQHFLIDPNLARAIAAEAGARPGDAVLEVGAGLGSLTLALAETGARVRAIEFDRALLPALQEVTAGVGNVDVVAADATRMRLGVRAEGRTVDPVRQPPLQRRRPGRDGGARGGADRRDVW